MVFLNVSDKFFRTLVVLSVCAAGLLAYVNSFRNEFVWDDSSSVLLHKHVQDPTKLLQLFQEDQHPFGRGQGNFYRPLLASSFMADFQVSNGLPSETTPSGSSRPAKVSPFLFHVSNLLWHLAATIGILLVLSRAGAPRFVQFIVPLLYVVHPLHTEAVTYISGRGDPMAAAFMFAGLWGALVFADKGRWPYLLLSSLCFCAALLCKESATISPVLLLLLLLIRRSENPGLRRWIPLGIAVAIVGIYGGLRMTVLNFASQTASETTLVQRLIETGQALALYAGLSIVPVGLHMERTLLDISVWVTGIGLLILAAGIGGVFYTWKRQRRLAIALLWFLTTWLPISGLFPLNAPMAEHWMYVPLAGLLWAVAEILGLLWARPMAHPFITTGLYTVFAFFLILTVVRNVAWRDNETLFLDTVTKNPDTARVHFNLAVTYEDMLGNPAGARREYEAVLKAYEAKRRRAATPAKVYYTDDELESHLSLGRIFFAGQDYRKAAQHYGMVANIEPDEAHKNTVSMALVGVGKCLWIARDTEKAKECFQRAASLDPALKPQIDALLSGG